MTARVGASRLRLRRQVQPARGDPVGVMLDSGAQGILGAVPGFYGQT